MKAAYSIGIVTLFDGEAKHQKLLYKWVLAMGTEEESNYNVKQQQSQCKCQGKCWWNIVKNKELRRKCLCAVKTSLTLASS